VTSIVPLNARLVNAVEYIFRLRFDSDTSYTTVRQPTATRSSADTDKPARRVQRSGKVAKHGAIRYV